MGRTIGTALLMFLLLSPGAAAQQGGVSVPRGAASYRNKQAEPAERRPQPPPRPEGTDTHLQRLLERYAWVIPADTRSKATLGVLLFVVLAFVIGLAARVAGLDQHEFGRACGQALLVVALVAAHAAFPALSSPQWLPAALAADLALWLIASRLIFGASLFGGVVMLLVCTLGVAVGILLLEVAGSVLELTHQG